MRNIACSATALAASLALTCATQAGASGAIGSETAQPVITGHTLSAPAASDFDRARQALLAGDYDRAVFLLEPLADGAGVPAQLLAGYANLGAGRIGRAELYFNRTLGRDRQNAFSRHGLGLSALAKGDRAGAAAQLELLQDAAQRCHSSCARASDIASALTSLQRAIG